MPIICFFDYSVYFKLQLNDLINFAQTYFQYSLWGKMNRRPSNGLPFG